jgi:hypothetical protein
MKYPEGWELREKPSEAFPTMHVLYRHGVAWAAITFNDHPNNNGGGWWQAEALEASGSAWTGYGYESPDRAAQFVMKNVWEPVAPQPDLSDLDDEDYDYARQGAPIAYR